MKIVRFNNTCPFSPEIIERDFRDAITWANDVLIDPRAVILDTETTGLRKPYCVQLSAITINGEVVFDGMFNPRAEIEAEASAVHGMTRETLSQCPDFYTCWPDIQWIFRNSRVIVYNADYDRGVLLNELSRMKIPFAGSKLGTWECAMKWYSKFRGEWSAKYGNYKWHKLKGGDHTALGDCRATAELIKSMAGW